MTVPVFPLESVRDALNPALCDEEQPPLSPPPGELVVVAAAKLPLSVPTEIVLPAATALDRVDVAISSVPAPVLLIATLPTEVPPIVTATLVPSAAVSPVTLITAAETPNRLPDR